MYLILKHDLIHPYLEKCKTRILRRREYYTTSTTTIQLVGTCTAQHHRKKKREDLVLGDLSFFNQGSMNNMMWGAPHEAYVAWLHGYGRLEKNK